MDLTEKTINQKLLYRGKIVSLRVDDVQLPNHRLAKREVVEHPGGVTIAALTEKEELLFVRQYRYAYGQVLLEIPAGKLEPGEDPLEAGKRELQEETGARAAHYRSLGCQYPSPGYCNEVLHLYLATGLTFGDAHPDDDEFLCVEKIPLDQAVKMVLAGEIPDGKTQTIILKIALLKQLGELDTLG